MFVKNTALRGEMGEAVTEGTGTGGQGQGGRGPTGVFSGGRFGEGCEAVSLAELCLRLPALAWLSGRGWHIYFLSVGDHIQQPAPVSPPSVLGVDDILTSPGVSTCLPTLGPSPPNHGVVLARPRW